MAMPHLPAEVVNNMVGFGVDVHGVSLWWPLRGISSKSSHGGASIGMMRMAELTASYQGLSRAASTTAQRDSQQGLSSR